MSTCRLMQNELCGIHDYDGTQMRHHTTRALTLLSSQLDFGCVGIGCFQLCTTLQIVIVTALKW